jgi:hypothetical protein
LSDTPIWDEVVRNHKPVPFVPIPDTSNPPLSHVQLNEYYEGQARLDEINDDKIIKKSQTRKKK